MGEPNKLPHESLLVAAGVLVRDEFGARRLRVIAQTSASQIGAHEICERLWMRESVMGARPPKPTHQGRGTHVDLAVQQMIKTGRVPADPFEYVDEKTGKKMSEGWAPTVEKARKYLPGPGSLVLVQAEARFPAYEGGPTVVGYPDAATWRDGPGGWLHIDDTKTSSDFKYAKSREQLADDTQGLTYAKWGYDELGARRVTFAHVVMRTKRDDGRIKPLAISHPRPHAYDRDRDCKCDDCREWLRRANGGILEPAPPVEMARDEVAARWEVRADRVRVMVRQAREAESHHDLPPSTEHCDFLFGKPCPHRKACGLAEKTLSGIFGRKTKETKMGETSKGGALMERLEAAKAAKRAGGAAAAPAATTTTAPAKKPEAEKPAEPQRQQSMFDESDARIGAALDMIKTGKLIFTQSGNAFVKNEVGGWTERAPTQAEIAARERHLAGEKKTEQPASEPSAAASPSEGAGSNVVPFDAPARESTAAEVKDVNDAAKAKQEKRRATKEEKAAKEAQKKADAEAAAEAAAQAAAAPAKKDEGAELEALQEEQHERAATAAEASAKLRDELAKKPAPGARKVPAVKPTLLVDCAATKGIPGAVHLEEWLAPIAEIAASAHEVEDYRLISYTSKGVLATAIRASLDTCPAVLLVDSRQAGADVALEVLVPHAAVVVRGF